MKLLCGGDDIINYNDFIGSGTHGSVYGSYLSSMIAVKIFNIQNCDDVKRGEFAFQETSRLHVMKYQHLFDDDVIINIPKVYGFKYLPTTHNPKCCMYFMDRLINIVQLAFNYDRLYDETLSSGRYVGIDTLKLMGYTDKDISMMNRSIASCMSILHYGMKIDAYDVEFVLDQQNKINAIDYDKVNYYHENYPYIIKRKLAENQYENCRITNQHQLSRFLAKAIMYCPHIDYKEYEEWKNTYIHIATHFNKQHLAEHVMTQYEYYF